MRESTASFSDPVAASSYADRTMRIVPGLRDLHKMAGLLIAERVPVDARVLVLGAGGGLELKAFADMQHEWRFDGVDPSREMLQLAKVTLGAATSRVTFHESTINAAPEGPFDAAVCLLTLHFLAEEERRYTVKEVFRRLRSGAPFVVAHHSFPNRRPEQERWLARYAAFAEIPETQAESSMKAMKERLNILSPDQDVAILSDAGFRNIEQFYAGFTFKGWVGYKDQ
jgi:tRNA (cmo5U34)-methyltransferase